MRGVILQETDARLVDITHEFPRQDVATAAFWLREIVPWFPPAVHCVVVDPGVGTDRAALIVEAGDHSFVGPDNGVLLPVARVLGEEVTLYEIEYDAASTTFHGRDVFAPWAARVHDAGLESVTADAAVSRFSDPVDLTFPDPQIQDGVAQGEILVVDGFGNAVTNIPGTVLESAFGDLVSVGGEEVRAVRTYAVVEPGTPVVTVGSHGNVELAVNQGRGSEVFDVGPGDAVTLQWG